MDFTWTTDTHSQTYMDALNIRQIVFITEQNVAPELEIDDLEDVCHHLVAYINHAPVATARLYFKNNGIAKVQRVAVLATYRGQQIGKYLLEEVERYAKLKNNNKLILGAQNHAIPFYEKLGYTVYGEEYEDANILHHDMEKTI